MTRVGQFKNNVLVQEWKSVREAAKSIGVAKGTIGNWLRGDRTPSPPWNEYQWKYIYSVAESQVETDPNQLDQYGQYDTEGTLVATYNSCQEIATAMDVKISTAANWFYNDRKPSSNQYAWKRIPYQPQEDETFLLIHGFEISNYGTVRYLLGTNYYHSKGFLRQGYRVTYRKKQHYLVHRLVARMFLNDGQPLFYGQTIDHLDSNPANNHVSNLQIVDFNENQLRRQDNVKRKRIKKEEPALKLEDPYPEHETPILLSAAELATILALRQCS
jgi:hypothetical protein